MITNNNVMNWATFQSRVQNLSTLAVKTYRFKNLLARPNIVLSGKRQLVVVTEAFDPIERYAPNPFDVNHAILNAYITARSLRPWHRRSGVTAILAKDQCQCTVEDDYPEIRRQAKAILDNWVPSAPIPVAALLCSQSLSLPSGCGLNSQREKGANGTDSSPPVNGERTENADIDSGR